MKTIVAYAFILTTVILASCARTDQPSTNMAPSDVVRVAPSPSPLNTAVPRSAGERGTPDEAKTMMLKAVEHYSTVGRAAALKDFNAKTVPFGDRDLYVACIDSNHKLAANGGYPALVGSSTDAWKDADGNSLGKAIEDAMSTEGEATVRYRWYNPLSKKIEPKIGFFHRVGTDVCGVGAYNP